jgi:hypothetical protein
VVTVGAHLDHHGARFDAEGGVEGGRAAELPVDPNGGARGADLEGEAREVLADDRQRVAEGGLVAADPRGGRGEGVGEV